MTKKLCIYCGNNQTNHAFAWFDQSFSVLMTGLNRTTSRFFLARWFFTLLDFLTPYLISVLAFVKIVRFNTDREKLPSGRGKVIWDEAVARGYEIVSIIAFGRYLDVYKVTLHQKTIIFFSLPTIDGQSKDSVWWMDDKGILKKKLLHAGVPVARGGTHSSWRGARKQFEMITQPVITKPRIGSRGRHTTTSIFTEEQLHDAFRIAQKLCHFVIVEEHLVGSVYRGTVIDGEVVGILRGDPPRVTGDGMHTIARLVEIKNANRDTRVSAVTLTKSHDSFLSRTGYTRESVLPDGVTIDLIEKVGLSYGGASADLTATTHPKIVEALKKATTVIDYPIIGFDFIIDDVSKDPDTQKWGIIEANSAPFIDLHHHPLVGESINVAGKVWDMVERKLGVR